MDLSGFVGQGFTDTTLRLRDQDQSNRLLGLKENIFNAEQKKIERKDIVDTVNNILSNTEKGVASLIQSGRADRDSPAIKRAIMMAKNSINGLLTQAVTSGLVGPEIQQLAQTRLDSILQSSLTPEEEGAATGRAEAAAFREQTPAILERERQKQDLVTQETFEDVLDDQGNIIGQRNTKTGRVVSDPRADKSSAEISVPGLNPNPESPPTKNDAKAIKTIKQSKEQIDTLMEEYRALVEEFGAEPKGSRAGKKIAQKISQIVLQLKNLEELGALQEADRKIAEDMIGSPLTEGMLSALNPYNKLTLKGTALQQAASFEKYVKDRYETAVRNRGFLVPETDDEVKSIKDKYGLE